MRSVRTILAVFLSCAMFASLAVGNVGARMDMPEHRTQASHDCCKKKAPEQQKKNPCDGSGCVMQCCRIILSQPDAVPQLSDIQPAPEVVIVAPVVSNSINSLEAIFHPPRV